MMSMQKQLAGVIKGFDDKVAGMVKVRNEKLSKMKHDAGDDDETLAQKQVQKPKASPEKEEDDESLEQEAAHDGETVEDAEEQIARLNQRVARLAQSVSDVSEEGA